LSGWRERDRCHYTEQRGKERRVVQDIAVYPVRHELMIHEVERLVLFVEVCTNYQYAVVVKPSKRRSQGIHRYDILGVGDTTMQQPHFPSLSIPH
jgi:hypothetical protein